MWCVSVPSRGFGSDDTDELDRISDAELVRFRPLSGFWV
ncbi:Uncharacterised protein [Mycobacterium tuberculosis]|nr:Uncharacterised protein [Mycobacterium tuberculosis]